VSRGDQDKRLDQGPCSLRSGFTTGGKALVLATAAGYLGAAVFYATFIGIFTQYQIACPLCPIIDVFGGGGFPWFLYCTAIYGSMNAFLLVVPLLGLMAYKAWSVRIRREVAGWRAAIGLASVALTLLGWLLMYPSDFVIWRIAPGLDSPLRSSVVPIIALGTSAALALSGKPKVYLLLAGLGMLALCRFMLDLTLCSVPFFGAAHYCL